MAHIGSSDQTIALDGASALSHYGLDFTVSQPFLVLPSDIEHWDDLDPITHKFRLFFVCEGRCRSSSGRWFPSSFHFSDHPGYELDRPQEFFQRHGHFALMILSIFKQGCSTDPWLPDPKMDRVKIFTNNNGTTLRHYPYVVSIEALVIKATEYIQRSLSTIHTPGFRMRGSSILQLKSYLSSQCEDGVPGNLFRNLQFKQFNWLCREHALEGRLVTPLEQLTRSQGWKVSLEPSTLAFELTSTAQAARLGSALKQSTGCFEITIQIAWEASKQELGSALLRIGECQGSIIHVDRIPLSIGTQGPLELGEIFAEFTVLHHYPRPLDRYIHLKRFQDYTCGLLLDGSSALPEIDWFGFRTALGSGIDTIIYPGIFSRNAIGHSFQVLSKTLEPYKALAPKGIDLFDWKSNTWQGRLRVKNGIICGLEETVLPNKFFHPSLLEFGTLRKLVVRSALTEEKSWLFTLMDLNLRLQQLEIPAQENEMFSLLSELCHSWNWQWKNVKVALFETGSAYKTRLSAEVVMSNSTNITDDGHLLFQVGSDGCVGAVVDVLQWDRDHVSGYLSDSDVAILDMATDRFPSALSFFILNVSSLSHQGLLRLKSVFHKSDLGRVAIECVPFNPSCKDDIAQLLRAMNWSIIQHLSWSGEYIDDWIQLWARNGDLLGDAFSASSLLRLDILGTGNTELSHLSALVIHSIIYDRPQIELNLQDVLFQDSSDLELISRALGDAP